jgi:hypothetical protein
MSEYQYYEFQAIDRPLGATEQAALRAISTRARITSTGFTNTYEWGDLKANPIDLLARYFDVFLYLANWNSRRFALRLPHRLVDIATLRRYGIAEDIVHIERRGEHVVIDMFAEEIATKDWEDGSGRLAGLAPLRAAVIDGDHSLFLLLWLIEVERGAAADDAVAPLDSPGRLSAPIAALGDFLGLDPDLIALAFEGAGNTDSAAGDSKHTFDVEAAVRSLSDEERVAFLRRLYEGNDAHLGAELRRRCKVGASGRTHPNGESRPTAGELRHAAARIADARKQRAAEQAAVEQRRKAEAEAAERGKRLEALARRGEACWRDVEARIELRNAAGYDEATALLLDLSELAATSDQRAEFGLRVARLAQAHARKGQFVRRLAAARLIR